MSVRPVLDVEHPCRPIGERAVADDRERPLLKAGAPSEAERIRCRLVGRVAAKRGRDVRAAVRPVGHLVDAELRQLELLDLPGGAGDARLDDLQPLSRNGDPARRPVLLAFEDREERRRGRVGDRGMAGAALPLRGVADPELVRLHRALRARAVEAVRLALERRLHLRERVRPVAGEQPLQGLDSLAVRRLHLAGTAVEREGVRPDRGTRHPLADDGRDDDRGEDEQASERPRNCVPHGCYPVPLVMPC